ncbi:MAG: ABC transporter substrate-binding protein [Negativicutes bacterium]|nr:ABC transporter substrate-binding protein [Negativicutes bacterium]
MNQKSNWKKKVCFLLAGVALAGLVAGCGGDKKADDGNTIKIGANFELTGAVAVYGQSGFNGVELAVEEINAAGGVNGKKLELVKYDTKSEVSEATNGATKLITENKVKALIGPATSGAGVAAQQIATDNKIPMISPSGTAENVTVDNKGMVRKYIFRTPFIDSFQGIAMGKFASTSLKAKTAAIYLDNSSDYAKGFAKYFEEEFVKSGGTVVTKEAYLQKHTDFKSTITKMKASNPDVIYVPGYYQEVSMIIKQARELGMNQPMLGGDGWDSPKLAEVAGAAALENTYMSNHYASGDSDPKVKAFEEKYQKKYGAKPEAFAALGYDSVYILVDAIKRAGGTDGDKVAEALAKAKDLDLVTGKFSFDEKHNPIKTAVIVAFKKGEKFFHSKVNP